MLPESIAELSLVKIGNYSFFFMEIFLGIKHLFYFYLKKERKKKHIFYCAKKINLNNFYYIILIDFKLQFL